MSLFTRFSCVVFATLAIAHIASAQSIHNGTANYFSFADSPFFGFSQTTPNFWLEDFEDGRLNTPGVSGGGFVELRNDPFSDSVDGDDGIIDGHGTSGGATTGAVYSESHFSITFYFDANKMGGSLPTHVGLVVTDASINTAMTLTAMRDGVALGSVSGFQVSELFDLTAQDRFYGFIDAGGIDMIVMTAAGTNDWSMDHLQYGYEVPAPSSLLVVAAGLLGRRRRRRLAEIREPVREREKPRMNTNKHG